MTVIINEFEIDVKPPSNQQASEAQSEESTTDGASVSPMDVREIHQWYADRQTRLWAH